MESAAGLLKEEMRRFGSLLTDCAARLPPSRQAGRWPWTGMKFSRTGQRRAFVTHPRIHMP